MRTFILTLSLALAAFAPALTAQAAPPAPSQGTPQASGITLRAQTRLVVVDVVVTDRDHKPVHGLTASDFSLTENNVPQTIGHFDEHMALTAADATKFPVMPKMPPGVFTNYNPAPLNGSVNVLLLDTLNTPMRDQSYVRQQLLAYLKTSAPGTRIAIFGLTRRLSILQGFSSDPEILKNALTHLSAKGSPLLDDKVGGGGLQDSTADKMEDSGANATVVANVREFEAVEQSFQLQLRARYTLDAMNQIAHYLAGIPGRKNLIWFSGSFPVNIMPDSSGTLPNPFIVMASAEDEFRDTVNLLARSQVAVYPVDARGLMASPAFDASSSRNYGRNPGRMNQDLNKFSDDLQQEHSTMREMAEATGGHAFVNTNGLSQAVATAISEGSNFYTLTYSPTNTQPDGKLRKIKVQVNRQGLSLAYRRGYYADPPPRGTSTPTKPGAAASVPAGASATGAGATPAGPSPSDTMRAALMRGSPTPSDILLKVAVLPAGPPSQLEDAAAPGNLPAANVHGPYRRYVVGYGISASNIAFLRDPDGKVHADFDLVMHVYDTDGRLVNASVTREHVNGTIEDMRSKFANGIHPPQREISAPAKGNYFLRIAVHDLNRDRYGAIEVATSDLNTLTPPPAAPAPPPAPAPGTAPAPAPAPPAGLPPR